MSLENVIEKIRKLRALSQSSNVNEAAAAASAAERLIQEHRIAEAELANDSTPEDEILTEELDIMRTKITWQSHLRSHLVRYYGCATYNHLKKYDGATITKFIIIGSADNIATVRYMYLWLTVEIEHLCSIAGLRGKAQYNSFKLGAVSGISDAMKATNQAVRATASSNALVRIDHDLERAKAALPSGLRKGTDVKTSIDLNAYNKGVQAGKSIHTGKTLASGKLKLLGDGS